MSRWVQWIFLSSIGVFGLTVFGDVQSRSSSLQLFDSMRRAEVRAWDETHQIPIQTEVNGRIRALHLVQSGIGSIQINAQRRCGDFNGYNLWF